MTHKYNVWHQRVKTAAADIIHCTLYTDITDTDLTMETATSPKH